MMSKMTTMKPVKAWMIRYYDGELLPRHGGLAVFRKRGDVNYAFDLPQMGAEIIHVLITPLKKKP